MKKKAVSLLLTAVMISSLAACGSTSGDEKTGNSSSSQQTENSGEETASDSGDVETLEVFSQGGSYQGLQGGWYAKALKDALNIELNIISPNASGGGDSLYQTRSVAGNLGDIVILDYQKMKECVASGLVIDMSSYLEGKENLSKYQEGIDNLKEYIGEDGIYAIPSDMSLSDPSEPMLNNGQVNESVFMPWDYYKELDMPDIADTDQLLDVMEQMQKNHPTSELSGGNTYGFSLFKDWDWMGMALAKRITAAYGFADTTETVYTNGDCSETSVLTDDDGAYYKALKLLYEANQRGLVDPDSSAQDFATMQQKFQNKEVLYAWYPWLITAFNNSHKKDGTGYAYIPVGTQKIVTGGYNKYGGDKLCWGIGSQAKDPEKIAEYFDWMCTSEAVNLYAWNILGYNYELKDGKPVIIEQNAESDDGLNTVVPDEFGGGTLGAGACQVGTSIASKFDTDPVTGENYDTRLWTSTIESEATQQDAEWTERFGAATPLEYLKEHDMLDVAPGSSYIEEQESTDMDNKRNQCSTSIIQASWQMVFASNDAEFQQLWDNMKTELDGLGFADVVAADQEKVAEIKEARAEAVK